MRKTTPRAPQAVYQLKITLRGAKPPIWRRVQVPADFTLKKLHRVIQLAMGWTDSHLHLFDVGGIHYSDPEFEVEETNNEARIRLSQAAPVEKAKFRYEYDFGDSWDHEILVEKILPPDPAVRYPICLTGKRACPPEDCGGVWGYAELLETLADPDSEDHEEMLEWLDGDFDPEEFDVEMTNAALTRAR